MSEQKRPYIEIEHFSFYYPERTEKVLDDLTLTVEQGEFLVLCLSLIHISEPTRPY